MSDIFSPEATKAALDRLPANQGGIGIAVEGHDVGVQGAAQKSIGKGWSIAATGEWFKDKGYKAAAWLGWKGSGR